MNAIAQYVFFNMFWAGMLFLLSLWIFTGVVTIQFGDYSPAVIETKPHQGLATWGFVLAGLVLIPIQIWRIIVKGIERFTGRTIVKESPEDCDLE